MAGVKGNRRVLYTKRVIEDSLIKLLETKEIHQVTVTDICKNADINRGTFYTHYKDAYDLLESMEDKLFNQFLEYINENPMEDCKDSLFIKVLELILENKDLCKVLFCKRRDDRILDRLIYIANKANFEHIYNNSNEFTESYLNYYIRHAVGGGVAIVQTWLENDLPEPPAEIVKILNSMNTWI